MFRKPKQRNLRGRTDVDPNEEEHEHEQMNVSDTPPAVVQQQTVTTTTVTKTVVKKSDAPKSLLSFGDDEGKGYSLWIVLRHIYMDNSR